MPPDDELHKPENSQPRQSQQDDFGKDANNTGNAEAEDDPEANQNEQSAT